MNGQFCVHLQVHFNISDLYLCPLFMVLWIGCDIIIMLNKVVTHSHFISLSVMISSLKIILSIEYSSKKKQKEQNGIR